MKVFIEKSLKKVPALNGKKYLRYLKDKRMDDPSAYGGNMNILMDLTNDKERFVADTDRNKANGWLKDNIDQQALIERIIDVSTT